MRAHQRSRTTLKEIRGGRAYRGAPSTTSTTKAVGVLRQRVHVGQCPVCDEWITLNKDDSIRAHRVGTNRQNSWPCPGGGSEEKDHDMGKEMRELLAELKELNFTWEITSQNHVKAKAPNGEMIVFSVGGKARSTDNQRALLNKWKRDNLKPADQEEELPEESAEQPQISPLVVKAIEAMVYVIQSESVSVGEVDDLKAEVELLREENARLTSVNDEMTRLAETLTARVESLEGIEAKFNRLKKAFE